ncbi:extracellular solute-binding protein [Aestuariibius sp. HNIBRBA575]|uniref:extracellular solute-binding protein n=1 Tax=Aestuariibius sp. HNIBRBA575 TaxID=3233343 RepID=UPI0034A2340B
MRNSTFWAVALATTVLTTPASVMADGHLQVVDEPLELSIHLHDRRFTYVDDWPVEQEAARMTGVSLRNATAGNTTDSEEAFNLMLASGDIPDIVGGARFKDNANRYGPEGAFIPLQDLIAEYAPNIQAQMDARPEIFASALAADGNMYFVPYLTDGKYGRAYFIREDWLETLGLDHPQNVEELHAVLTAFRNGDPNGNGEMDEVPAFFRNWEEILRLVTFWDGRSSGSDTYHDFHIADGEVRHGYVGDGYRDGIKHIAQWYAEGLIDPEVFTRGSSARDYLLSNDLGGFTHDWFASTAGYNDSVAEAVPGFSFQAFPPPESISGVRMEEHRRIPIKPEGWAISYTNENPVETIKYMDFWWSEEGRRLANFGIEGEQYTLVDGAPVFTEEFLAQDGAVNAKLNNIGAQVRRGFWQDYNYEIQWSNEHALRGIALYDQGDYLIDQFLGVAFNEAEQDVYDDHWISIRTYMLERQQAWILGTGNVEDEWDDYLAQLDRLGMTEVLAAMQSAYDRQYGE